MANREEFIEYVNCTCGNKGSVTWSENANPYRGTEGERYVLDREVVEVSKGFEASNTKFNEHGGAKIKCSKCGKDVT